MLLLLLPCPFVHNSDTSRGKYIFQEIGAGFLMDFDLLPCPFVHNSDTSRDKYIFQEIGVGFLMDFDVDITNL